MTATERSRAFRARARAQNRCIVCGGPKRGRKAKTCKTCSDAAYERVKRWRARA